MHEEIEFVIVYSVVYGALMVTRIMSVMHNMAGIRRFKLPVVTGIMLASINIFRWASGYIGMVLLTTFLASEIFLYRRKAKGTGVWP